MGFIRDKTNIGVKMLGDKKANIVFGTHSPCSAALELSRVMTACRHVLPVNRSMVRMTESS